MIQYTAKRSLVTGHQVNRVYDLPIDIVEATAQVSSIKEDQRSSGGAIETLFERQDVVWTIRTAPVAGDEVLRLQEFLDSIESGETFRVWLRDTDVLPLVLKMHGDAGTQEAFMRTGTKEKDSFFAQFTALQAASYDITGMQPGGGTDGIPGGDSDPIDPYDPDSGGDAGGGLDQSALGDFTFVITCGSAFSGAIRGYRTGTGSLDSNEAEDRVRVASMETNTIATPDRVHFQLYNYFPGTPNPLPSSLVHQHMFNRIVVESMGTFYAADATFEFSFNSEESDTWNATWYWDMTSQFPTSGTRQIDVLT